MTKNRSIKFIDLFSGMGGFRIGFESACKELELNAECVFSSEIKEAAITAYHQNFNEMPSGNIESINTNEIPYFDILLAGFPCQPFSSAGNREGFLDTRGTLFFEIERILKEKKPHGFILENVDGLINHDKLNDNDPIGRTLNVMLKSLQSLGYRVTWKVLNSSDFGLAQSRKRVFIIGSLKSEISLNNFKKKTTKLKDVLESGLPTINSNLTKILLDKFHPHELFGKSIKDKRGGKNNIHSWDLELKGPCSNEQKKLLSELLKVRRYKKWADIIGIEWMDGMPLTCEQIYTFFPHPNLQEMLDDLTSKKYLKLEHPKDRVPTKNENGIISKKRVPRTDLPKGYNIVAGKMSYEISKILDPESLTPTLVAMDIDRLVVVDNNGLRNLSDIEQKRLFGFPDNYDLSNLSIDDRFDLFGNTVPIPVVTEISKLLIIDLLN